jgi:tetratricopeptide (TPR) repeat protein
MIPVPVGWLFGKVLDKAWDVSLEKLFGPALWKDLDKALESWTKETCKTFPQLQWRSFLRVYESDTVPGNVVGRQHRDKVVHALTQQESVTIDDWLRALIEQWGDVKKIQGADAELFFRADVEQVKPFLEDLARRLFNATARFDDQFKPAALKLLQKIDGNTRRPRTIGAILPIWNVPHLRNTYFTGREKLLGDLQKALVSDKASANTQVINGLGGIGKTQLAAEYCYRYRKQYNVVWWVRSEEKATLSNDFAGLALKLNLPQCEIPDQAVVISAVTDWLNQNSGWLLVFDNAADPGDVRSFIPQAQTGHVIVTSRKKEWEDVAQAFPLTDFERDESVEYLLKKTGSNDHHAANELSEELGDLPLALAQAAGYINSAKTTIFAYSGLFKEHRAEMLKRRRMDSDYPFTVATTWSLSLDQAKKQTLLAEDLLKLMAFFAPYNIPRDLLEEGLKRLANADDLAFEDAVAALQTNSLIEATVDSLSLHRLVQFVTSERMESAEQKVLIQTIVELMDKAFSSLGAPPQDVRSWPRCALLLPHAAKVISIAEEISIISMEFGSLMNWCGMHWHGRANYAEAEPLYRRALRIREEQLGTDHPDVAASSNDLATLLQAQGKYAEAEPLYRRALRIREEQLGTDHLDVANSLSNLATLLQDEGKYAEAEPMCRRALKIQEEQLGANHPDVANSVSNLATLLQDQGKYAEAEPLYRRGLKIREEQLGTDHPDVAISLNNLAALLQDEGKYAEAEPLYRRALKIHEEQLGTDHPDVANSLNNLAVLLQAQGKYAEAEPLYRDALKICKERLGIDDPNTKAVKRNLDAMLDQLKRHGAKR